MILLPLTPAIATALAAATTAGARVAPPSGALPADAVVTSRGGSVGLVLVAASEELDEGR